jgi:hypothetical protein
MDDSPMTENCTFADGTTLPWRSMNNNPLLYGYLICNIDRAVVSTKNCAVPDVATASDPHISYQQSCFTDICACPDNGFFSVKSVKH